MCGKRALPALLALLLLSGCSLPKLTLNPQELYTLPALPAQYTELSGLINGILGEGAEYAAPTSGTNIQPVQLVDLNGDGQDEAVAFFRNSADEKPLKICIFQADKDSYHLLDRIEGSGTSIYSVAYKDLDGDGTQEIAVGWKASAELQALDVYALGGGAARSLVRTDYVRYAIADLDGDGLQGLVVLRSTEEGDSMAEYYSWTEHGSLASRAPARVSCSMAELSPLGRVTQGVLQGGAGALFVTGVTEEQTAITDILTMRNGELVNIVLSEATGVSGVIAPFCALYPTDINGDGIMEVPAPVPLPLPGAEESPYRLMEWRTYDDSGRSTAVMRTYHNLDDGWYLRLPDTWRDRIYITRSVSFGEAAVTFYIRATQEPFLRISALTGSGREMRSVRGERFVLNRQSECIYTGELLDANHTWDAGLTEDAVRAGFSLILREWLPSDS